MTHLDSCTVQLCTSILVNRATNRNGDLTLMAEKFATIAEVLLQWVRLKLSPTSNQITTVSSAMKKKLDCDWSRETRNWNFRFILSKKTRTRKKGFLISNFPFRTWITHNSSIMATLRLTLQRDVFQHHDERLVGLVNVNQASRKEENVLLNSGHY